MAPSPKHGDVLQPRPRHLTPAPGSKPPPEQLSVPQLLSAGQDPPYFTPANLFTRLNGETTKPPHSSQAPGPPLHLQHRTRAVKRPGGSRRVGSKAFHRPHEAGRPGQAPAIRSHLRRTQRPVGSADGRRPTERCPAPTSTPTARGSEAPSRAAPLRGGGRDGRRRGGRTAGTGLRRAGGHRASATEPGAPGRRRSSRRRASIPAETPRLSPARGGTGTLPPAPASRCRSPRRASPCPKPALNLPSEPHRLHGAPRAAAEPPPIPAPGAPPIQRGRPREGRRGRAALLPGSSAFQCGPATCTAAGSGAGSNERGAGPARRCGTGRGGAERSVQPAGSCSPTRRRLSAPRLRRRCGASVASAASPLPAPLPVAAAAATAEAAAPSAARGGTLRGGKRRRRRRGCPTALWRNG